MGDTPWLTIIGLGEDGLDGLGRASQEALANAEIVMGPTRHLALCGDIRGEVIEWPTPFADGLSRLTDLRGRPTVVLVSGDPFWFGAGSILARQFPAEEWRVIPGVSSFSQAAAQMGWAIESTLCLGLHAMPFARLRRELAPGRRAILLLRDGNAVAGLAAWLTQEGFGESAVTVLEALGGPRERVTQHSAQSLSGTFAHPVCAAVEMAGDTGLPQCHGLPDALFSSDGVMTKQEVRAITLSALAPRRDEVLWDIGAGSGSIAVEWCLSDPSCHAICIEPRADRANHIRANAKRFGLTQIEIVEARAPDALNGLARPDAVFVGGGLSDALLAKLETILASKTRVVANAVTLETEAILIRWHAERGGRLTRVALAHGSALGDRRGWKSAYPVVQWSVTW